MNRSRPMKMVFDKATEVALWVTLFILLLATLFGYLGLEPV